MTPTKPVTGGVQPFNPPSPDNWLAEPKYNGWRTLLYPDGRVFNRHGTEMQREKPGFLAECTMDEAILDCELMGYRNTEHEMALVVFDYIPLNPNSLEDGWGRRNELVDKGFEEHQVFSPLRKYEIVLSPQYPIQHTATLWDILQTLGDTFEGIVMKDMRKLYTSNLWRKFRYDQ